MLSQLTSSMSDFNVSDFIKSPYGIGLLFIGLVVGTYMMLSKLKHGEREKFGILSFTFGLVIGIYWMLRPLKDAIFGSVVGGNYIPRAKILSLFVVFPLVILYTKLVDKFPRQRVFYALCTIYGIIALVFAFIILNPSLGLANNVKSWDRWWGWAWYVYVESFGSLIVALFWAFVADTTTPESGAKGYPVIAWGGQWGNIFGPMALSLAFAKFTPYEVGPEGELPVGAAQQSSYVIGGMVIVAAIGMACIMLLIKYFMKHVPKDQLVGFKAKDHEEKHTEPGFFEGLKLIVFSPYLLSILGIITAYEVIVTILDFNFKVLVTEAYPHAHTAGQYLADYAMWVGLISMLSIMLRINKIQQMLGLGASLALLPILIACAVLMFKTFPIIGALFWIMVLSKAINYALNQPSMKQLYIPTTTDAKYKSQAFIEMYGSRGSKALGSAVNEWRKVFIASYGMAEGLSFFITLCTFTSLGIVALWLPITLYLGRTYKKAVDEKRVVV